MKTNLKKLVISIHFLALIILVSNVLIDHYTRYSLIDSIESALGMIVLLSGISYFILFRKPASSINYYFSSYALLGFLIAIAFIFRAIAPIIVLLLSVVLSPFLTDTKEAEQDGIMISVPFTGILSRCCVYNIKERLGGIFEKSHGAFEVEKVLDFDTITIRDLGKEFELVHKIHPGKSIKIIPKQ